MVPKDKYLKVNHLRLHYLDWGKGGHRAMLLLHGFMAHAHVWDEFASRFRKQYHIIGVDQRGHGESQWSKNGFYSMDDHFSDITEIIKILHLKNLIVMGHSMGGRNALFYAACSPHNIERLILIDARLSSNPKNSKALRHHLTHLPLQAFSLNEAVQAIQNLYPYLSTRKCHHLAYHGYKKTRDGKFVPKFDMRMSLQSNRLGCVTEDLRPFLMNIASPTLIIRGKESLFLSRADARKICNILPNAQMREIPKATHIPFQENPRAFQKVISDYLDEIT
jgi:pimeloyl-ACP methyl ester carboxylesterase